MPGVMGGRLLRVVYYLFFIVIFILTVVTFFIIFTASHAYLFAWTMYVLEIVPAKFDYSNIYYSSLTQAIASALIIIDRQINSKKIPVKILVVIFMFNMISLIFGYASNVIIDNNNELLISRLAPDENFTLDGIKQLLHLFIQLNLTNSILLLGLKPEAKDGGRR